MSDLFAPEGRAELARLCAANPLLGFDFDGTLAPIRPTPGEVAMDARTAAAFAALTRRVPVAVITGRALADVGPRLGGTPRWVIGNHGAEGMPDGDPARQAAVCAAWRAQLEGTPALAGAGIVLEDKRYSLSLHYRQAPDREAARARLLAQLHTLHPAPQIVGGKCVLNLMPAGSTDKFGALQALARLGGAGDAVFFIGDDDNDEIVFRQAPPGWVTVKVGGEGGSAARFRLARQEALADLLALLLEQLPASGR
jgi:trehalose 6-phosphate phosphatase